MASLCKVSDISSMRGQLLGLLLLASTCALALQPGVISRNLREDSQPFLRAIGEHLQTRRHGAALGDVAAPDLDAIREVVRKGMATFNVTGCAVGVIHDGQVILSEGFGKADIAAGTDVTDQTLFQIASNSKAFTAMSVLTMAEDGLLSLDLPLRNFYPSLRLKDPAISAELTLRDAMSHRSGMPRHDMVWLMVNETADELLERLRYLDFNKPTRYRTEYNNFMFTLAGQTAARVAGKSWGALVQERILSPLGMSRSYPYLGSVPQAERPNMAECYDSSYREGGKKVMDRTDADNIGPAGSLVSNIQDLSKWVLELNKMARGQDGIVKASTFREMVTPVALFPNVNNLFGSYGLGVWVEQYVGNVIMAHHGGNLNGMASHISWFPSLSGGGSGIIVLTNQNGSPLPTPLSLDITDILLGLPSSDWIGVVKASYERSLAQMEEQQREFERKRADPKVQKTRFALSNYTGHYKHPAYGSVIVRLKPDGKGLTAELPQFVDPGFAKIDKTFELEHLWYETFGIAVWGDYIPLTFNADSDNNVISVSSRLDSTVAPIVFTNERYRVPAGSGYQWPPSAVVPTPPQPASESGPVDLSRAAVFHTAAIAAAFSVLLATAVFALIIYCCGDNIGRKLNKSTVLLPN